MNNYIVHTAIKCSDDKVHRLSYDLMEQTEGSVKELGRVFAEIEKRFPDVLFWIHKYPESSDKPFIIVHGNKIQDSLKVLNAIRQIDEITTPEALGMTYTDNKV